jgi:SAM-dependent methyltransferase
MSAAIGAGERAYYEQVGLWDAARFATPEQRQRFADIAALLPAGCASLLDAGCGNGAFLAQLRASRPGALLAGVDRSAAAIAAGRQAYRLDLQVGDLAGLAFPDRAFAAVAALEVLEHLPLATYARVRSELARVAGEWILIDVPFRERREFLRCPACACRFPASYHLRTYDHADLPGLFPGFALVRAQPICPVDTPLAALPLRLVRRLRRPAFPPWAMCPLCGCQGGAAPVPAPRGALRRWLAWPRLRRCSEIVALYRRDASG